MQSVAIVVQDRAGMPQQYAYECHTPERLVEILHGTVEAMPDGWALESVTVA